MAGLSLQHPWAFAFGLLGNFISFLTFLAPIPTFYRIFKSKSTHGFQSVPYVVALFSSMLWIYYALIKTNETLLITINAAGCVIETIYIVMYLVYAPKKAKMFTVKIMLLLNVGVFGLIVLITLLLFAGERRVVMLGWVCVGFAVGVFVAPLSIMRRVIQTRSVEYMPFSLSLSLTLSAIVWFLYGLFIKDKYVALPNILGFTFGVVQMGLYVFYMNKTPVKAEGKEASKMAAAEEEHITVNIANLIPAVPANSPQVHQSTEMAASADPRTCAAEAAAVTAENGDAINAVVNHGAVGVV
ncbi:hypothetical protein ACP70R_019053 [Stipagrostis hirtigluma subsp. patula]